MRPPVPALACAISTMAWAPPLAAQETGAPPATVGTPAILSPPATPGAPPPDLAPIAPTAPDAAYRPPPLPPTGGASNPGAMNPAMSVIVDGSFGYYGRKAADFAAVAVPPSGDDPGPGHEGFTLQEVELAFQSAIDPYLEGAVFLTIPNLEGIEVEEAYLTTTALPGNLQVKAGSFRSQFGRNNGQHLHLQHFTRRPLMTPLFFGADGLRGPGLQASVLLPLPWFATFYAEAFSLGAPGPGDPSFATFGGGPRGPSSLAATAVLEQFWELGEATSLMLGANGATGKAYDCAAPPCPGPSRRDVLFGGDLYLKWRPANVTGERYSVAWTTEMVARTLLDDGPTEGALYSDLVAQVQKRWYVGGRFDLTGLPDGPNVPRRYGAAASVTFAPTEFSRLRLYGQDLWGPAAPSTLVGFLQVEISMGAHGAHPY